MRPSIYYDTVCTPMGDMHVGATETGIVMFEFPIEERVFLHKKKFSELFDETATPPDDILNSLKTQVGEYFKGSRVSFDLPLELVGTDFQLQVWNALLKVPFGKTISYLDLARSIGNTDGVRAVANANGQNRLPILIPCHRVIGANVKLTGYSGGISRKEKLLSLEHGQSRFTF